MINLLKKTSIQLGAIALAVTSGFLMTPGYAETVSTVDGTKTVIESVAPLGAALSYSGGGDGLVGHGATYPTGETASFAASNIDHTWLQFDPAIIWISPTSLSQVFAIPGIDHGPIPQENLEFIIWGSTDKETWEEGTIMSIYRDGFDTADTELGHSDDYTSLWVFSQSYKFFQATSGDHLTGTDHNFSLGEGEIDGLASVAAIPEPEIYAMMAAGLGLMGFVARRRQRKLAVS